MNENGNMINPLDPLGGALPDQNQVQQDVDQPLFQQVESTQEQNQSISQQAQPMQEQTQPIQGQNQPLFNQPFENGQHYQPSIALQNGDMQNVGFSQPQMVMMQAPQQTEQLSPKEQKKLEKQRKAEEKKKAAEEKKRLAEEAKAEKQRLREEAKAAKKAMAEEKKRQQAEEKASKKKGGGLFGKKKKAEETNEIQSNQQPFSQPQINQQPIGQPQMYTQEQLLEMINQGLITQEQAQAQWNAQLAFIQQNQGQLQQEQVQEPVAQQSVMQEQVQQEPIMQQPMQEPIQESMLQQPMQEQVQEPVAQQSVMREPIMQESVPQESMIQQPMQEQVPQEQAFGNDFFENSFTSDSSDMFENTFEPVQESENFSSGDMFASDDFGDSGIILDIPPTFDSQEKTGVSLSKAEETKLNQQEVQNFGNTQEQPMIQTPALAQMQQLNEIQMQQPMQDVNAMQMQQLNEIQMQQPMQDVNAMQMQQPTQTPNIIPPVPEEKPAKKGGLFGKKKEKEREGELKPKVVKDSEGISLKKLLPIFIGLIAFILLIVIFIIIKNVKDSNSKGTGSKETYYSLLNEAFDFNVGSFSYDLTVESAPTGQTAQGLAHDSAEEATEEGSAEATEGEENTSATEGTDTSTSEVTEDEEDTSATEGTDVSTSEETTKANMDNSTEVTSDGTAETKDEEVSEEKTLSAKTDDWDTYNQNDKGYWKSPNYNIKVSGVASAVNMCKFDIELTNQANQGLFTSVYFIDDTYYINLQSMKTWLEKSKDVYLIGLSESIPSSHEWVTAKPEDLKFISNYIDSVDEAEDATTTGFIPEFVKYQSMAKTMITIIQNATNNAGLSKDENKRLLNLTSEDIDLLSSLNNAFGNARTIYDSFIGTYGEKVTDLNVININDENKKQLLREEDNFTDALTPLIVGLSGTSKDTFNMNITGQASRINEGTSNNLVEGDLNLSYTYKDIDYKVKLNFKHDGVTESLAAPEGETTALTELSDGLVIDKTFDGLINYLNFTDIKYINSFELSNDIILQRSLADFAEYVNSLNVVDYKLNLSNIKSFIAEYKDSSKLDKDDENAQALSKIVSEYLVSMKSIDEVVFGEQASKNSNDDKKSDSSVEQYPKIKKKLGKLAFEVQVDKKATTGKLLVVKCTLLNTDIDKVKLKLSDFTLVKLDSSSVRANDTEILGGAGVDASEIKASVEVNPTDSNEFTLYFPTDSNQGQSSLIYKDNEIGYIINY